MLDAGLINWDDPYLSLFAPAERREVEAYRNTPDLPDDLRGLGQDPAKRERNRIIINRLRVGEKPTTLAEEYGLRPDRISDIRKQYERVGDYPFAIRNKTA